MASHANVPTKHDQERVVLIHGLMRTAGSMYSLQSFLVGQGYTVDLYSYPSTKYSIRKQGITLNRYLEQLLADNPHTTLHFVTHSLGGIILREALATLTPKQRKHIGYFVMLAPPNHGSVYASVCSSLIPFANKAIKPLAELTAKPGSYIHKVPMPKVAIGVIAGRFDAKAPPSSAFLAGQKDFVIVNAAHTFIMNNAKAREYIVHFLDHGKFTS